MGKHDLPERSRPQQPDLRSVPDPGTNRLTLPNGDTWNLSQHDVSTIVDMGVSVVGGLISVAKIKEETDSFIRRTEAETAAYREKMAALMQKDRQDADIWKEQFDRRLEALTAILDKNPGRSAAELSVLLAFLNGQPHA